ncbi:rhodoquinone biosynthesis methyltransferase RquA [Azonexus sp. IMCC34839]|uniref:rhodoquinone biosynthesis methyltransferase RquA n=1 Tax=Azonexus sp. IMCC34839 TaxID=3133695 RepID=UPI00399A19F6
MKNNNDGIAVVLPHSPLNRHHQTDIPDYLQRVYWWAYLHPNAVRLFEREWLVNLILWGNFARLRDAALAELGEKIDNNVLQIACVYGDFTQRIVSRLSGEGSLEVVDVAPIQLENLRRKIPAHPAVRLRLQDASALQYPDGHFDSTLLFFLLHEQPEEVRRATLAEAMRVTRPGGKIVIVDYHRPARLHPLNLPMQMVLRTLEPFAMDLWRSDIAAFLPSGVSPEAVSKTHYFGRLYQKVVVRV